MTLKVSFKTLTWLISHKQHDYKQGETKMWDMEPKHTDLDDFTSQLVAFDDSDSEQT